MEFVFLFAIAAGLVVLFAAISSTQDERIFEGAILRTLGASRRQLAILQLAEFLAIGLLSGLIAAVGAVGTAMVLSERVLNVPYDVSWPLPSPASSSAPSASRSRGCWARGAWFPRLRCRPSVLSPSGLKP